MSWKGSPSRFNFLAVFLLQTREQSFKLLPRTIQYHTRFFRLTVQVLEGGAEPCARAMPHKVLSEMVGCQNGIRFRLVLPLSEPVMISSLSAIIGAVYRLDLDSEQSCRSALGCQLLNGDFKVQSHARKFPRHEAIAVVCLPDLRQDFPSGSQWVKIGQAYGRGRDRTSMGDIPSSARLSQSQRWTLASQQSIRIGNLHDE